MWLAAARFTHTMWPVLLIALCAARGEAVSQHDVISTGPDFAENRDRVFWKIIGGELAKYGEFPYMLELEMDGSFICGASVIGDYWALTAAHCILSDDASSFTLRAGSLEEGTGGTVHHAKRVIKHHHYESEGNFKGDIALIEVLEALTSNKYVKPVSLPSHTDIPVPPGTILTVSGWGATRSVFEPAQTTALKKVQVVVLSKKTCQDDPTLSGRLIITDAMICAQEKGQSAYKGDSGGPLVLRTEDAVTQVGVVSWGDVTAQQKHPTVFTRVSHYRVWIYIKSGI